MIKNLSAVQEMWVQFQDWEEPLEEEMATNSSILAGKSMDRESLWGYTPWGDKSWTQLNMQIPTISFKSLFLPQLSYL